MNQDNNYNISLDAKSFFTSRYPRASKKELSKQINDWQNKVSSSEKLVAFFSERVGQPAEKKILDVGFGNGGVSIAFSKSGAKVFGIDIDPTLLSIAKKHSLSYKQSIDFQIYDGRRLPFQNNSFDYVVCASVFEHVSFPEDVIGEMLRVLKPTGRLLLTLPNKWAPKETHTLTYFVSLMPRTLAEKYLKLLGRSSLADDNLHFYSYFDIVKLLKHTGYSFRFINKDNTSMTVIKRIISRGLSLIGCHYTVLLPQLIFIVEKN